MEVFVWVNNMTVRTIPSTRESLIDIVMDILDLKQKTKQKQKQKNVFHVRTRISGSFWTFKLFQGIQAFFHQFIQKTDEVKKCPLNSIILTIFKKSSSFLQCSFCQNIIFTL